MPNIHDYGEYVSVLWGLWCQLRAAREQGVACQAASEALGRGALFTPEQAAAFTDILDTVKAEGVELLALGGARVLDGTILPEQYGAWFGA